LIATYSLCSWQKVRLKCKNRFRAAIAHDDFIDWLNRLSVSGTEKKVLSGLTSKYAMDKIGEFEYTSTRDSIMQHIGELSYQKMN